MRRRFVCLAFCAVALLLGCGDPATTDRRGYTKAPLERPGLVIRSAEHHDLRRFGRPQLPVAQEIELEATSQPPASGN
jgi:hypothetical protein